MSRSIQEPSIDIEDVVQPVAYGGTGANNASAAAATLKLIGASLFDSANGVASLDVTGKASAAVMPTLNGVQSVSVRGSRTILKSIISKFEISDFDSTKTYAVSVSAGTVAVSGKNISVAAPAAAQAMTMTINGRVINLTVVSSLPSKPVFYTPTAGSSVGNLPQRFFISDYNSLGDSVAHASTDWQVSIYPDFNTLAGSSNTDTVNKTSWTLATGLNPGNGYHVRARFRDANGNTGEWSDITPFRTRAVFGPNLEEAIIVSPDSVPSGLFSYGGVALSDDGLVLAVGTNITGYVYVFRRSTRGWQIEYKVQPSDWLSGDDFANGVSISGDGLRIAATSHNASVSSISNAGAVYIYVCISGVWSLEQKLSAGDKVTNDTFGRLAHLDASGTRCVIGADQWPGGNNGANGKAYIFSRSGSTWTQEAKLVAADAAANNRFGVEAAISRDGLRVAIGAIQATTGGKANAGAVYIFSRSGTTWSQEQKLTPPAPVQAQGQMGYAIRFSLDHTRVVVGEIGFGSETTGLETGRVSVYVRSGVTWTFEQILAGPTPLANYRFGIALDVSQDGTTIYVGETRYSAALGGRVHIFKRSGSTWTFQMTIVGSQDNPTGPGNYGCRVSLAGNAGTLAVAASHTTVNGNASAGKAYMYT